MGGRNDGTAGVWGGGGRLHAVAGVVGFSRGNKGKSG